MEISKSIRSIVSKPWFLLILPIVILTVIFFNTIKSNENCYYIKLNGIKFSNPDDTITFGRNDNVIFNPEYIDNNFLRVKHVNNGFYWESRGAAYLKLNDSNFNKHILSKGDIIRYQRQSLNYQDLQTIVSPYTDGQKYFSVSDFFQQEQTQSTFNYDYEEEVKPKSLLFCKDGEYQIILLDTLTTILRKDSVITALHSGFVKANSLKIQIINPKSTFFVSNKNPLFKNRDINVPTVRTEWQSSHLLCKFDSASHSTSVYYSQPLVIAFNKETIDAVTDRTVSRTMQIKQECDLMDKKTFYFEKFSNLFQAPIFSIQKADSTSKKDTIIYNTKNIQQSIVSQSRETNQSFKFAIASHINASVEAFGDFLYVSKWDLLMPFIILSACFIVSILFLFFFTNENKFLYSKHLDKLKFNSRNSIDFANIDVSSRVSDKTFSYLRLPIFSFVFILLIFKLVIVTKLTFTHPFFPQLYFVGCFMAFTTPLYISYFFVRNSWAMPALKKSYLLWRIPNSIFFTLGFILLNFTVYFITWHFIGSNFYKNYFESYESVQSLVKGFISLIKSYTPFIGSDNPILKEKYFQIPLLIVLIPLLFLIYDILNAILSKPKKQPTIFFREGLRSYIKHIDVLFICIIALGVFTKSTTILHLAILTLLFWYISHIIKIAAKISAFKKNTKNRFSYFRELIKHLTSLIFQTIAKQKFQYSLAFIIIILLFFFKVRSDAGIIINYFLIIPFIIFLTLIIFLAKYFDNERLKLFRQFILPVLPIAFFLLFILGYSYLNKPQIGDLDRTSRRINSIINKDDALETGGKQYLSDIQFLEIAQINAFENTKKPSFKFFNREKPQHEFISKGLYPVIINDLNPIVFLEYGGWLFLIALFLAWFFFYLNRHMIWNANFRLEAVNFDNNQFSLVQIFRHIPALIIISNSLWLFLSLFNIVFFTGRVVNGFGVDSIADWFETIAFAALMGTVIFSKPNQTV